MKMKKFFFLIRSIGIFMIIILMNQTFVVEAESVQSVETGGSLSFYGTYESEIEPQPGPHISRHELLKPCNFLVRA